MGAGLTVAASTWYHVFSIVNAGAADVYFDTSVTAANAPSGTTAFRRIGSILTDASSHIVAFSQNGDEFLMGNSFDNVAGVATPTVAALITLSNVPPGVKVNALFSATLEYSSGTDAILFWSQDQPNVGIGLGGSGQSLRSYVSGEQNSGMFNVRTNTSQQIYVNGLSAAGIYYLNVLGYIDRRGRDG
jgi:hypothetical protein